MTPRALQPRASELASDDVDKAAKSLAALRALIAELSLAKPCIVEYHRHFEAARALYAAMTEANRAARDSNEVRCVIYPCSVVSDLVAYLPRCF